MSGAAKGLFLENGFVFPAEHREEFVEGFLGLKFGFQKGYLPLQLGDDRLKQFLGLLALKLAIPKQ
jgi:hypothetical protein